MRTYYALSMANEWYKRYTDLDGLHEETRRVALIQPFEARNLFDAWMKFRKLEIHPDYSSPSKVGFCRTIEKAEKKARKRGYMIRKV